jgi:nucleotide-binding universal stress UspA family protein
VKRILVALDASPRAPAVLEAACRLAGLSKATLVLFRAIGPAPGLPDEAFAVHEAELAELLLRHGREDLGKLAKNIGENIPRETVVQFATPWDGICRAAREQRADLVVIGSHGYGGLDRILGTTAGKVVNHADRNVLVVRTPL